ncbi:MAG: thioredoxin [Anaerolineae bacterium]|nr:thioredoxin [Anaerolineae bacterium]
MGANTFEATTANFQTEVLNSETPVLVDFWAEWCGPCKMVSPIVEEIANEYGGKLRVAKLDADTNQDVIMQYGIMGIPTLILFKGGEAVARVTGYKPKDKITSELGLAKHLN